MLPPAPQLWMSEKYQLCCDVVIFQININICTIVGTGSVGTFDLVPPEITCWLQEMGIIQKESDRCRISKKLNISEVQKESDICRIHRNIFFLTFWHSKDPE